LLIDRIKGVPVDIEVRMETQSILIRTLSLFGLTIALAAAAFALVIWWVMRHGRGSRSGDLAI
jgi:hypothetical protein